MKLSHSLLGLLWVMAFGVAGCTDADLFETPGLGEHQSDNKLSVRGEFCTEHPDELRYPVKILFIIDCSQSMRVTDPAPSPEENPGRVRAIWEVIQTFRHDPGVEFAILRFDSAANVVTQRDSNGDGIADQFGFVNDLPALLRGLNALIAASGNTSYQAALGLAEATLAMDMSSVNLDERSRTKYVVVFLSDGLPYPVNVEDDVNTPESIQRAVGDLKELAKRFDVTDIAIHTAYLSVNTPDYIKQQAEQLLTGMAETGSGTYRNFQNGEEINFLDIDYTSIKRTYQLKNGAFMVYNLNAHPGWNQKESTDTDGDGLVDGLEISLGTSIVLPDTDDDGFGDLLEYNLRNSGFDPLDPNDADCSLSLDRLDRDGDGLRDCEERFIGTDPELFDTDLDGMADPIEFRAGTNPVWADINVDMDYDGSLNGQELAWHTNPTADDAAQFSKLAYRYRLARKPGIFESRMCYEFRVDNITLTGTDALETDKQPGENQIMVYSGQIPQDDPLDHGTFRVACARVRYIPRYPQPDIKNPASGLVTFTQKDFKRPVASQCRSDKECPHHVCDPKDYLCLHPLGEPCDAQSPCGHFSCIEDQHTGEKSCIYPVQVACLQPEDCPPYPVHPQTGLCMDPDRSTPDPLTGACPRRSCVPQYQTCNLDTDCRDTDQNPDNDPVCLMGFCRKPCEDAGDCNPGETCDPDGQAETPICQIPSDCPNPGMECIDGLCKSPCTDAVDCPNATATCESDYCVGHHCVDHHGGSCAGVMCEQDIDCPIKPCDPQVGRCRDQPCLDSRQCPHQHCELVLGFCMGSTCNEDRDCRRDRGFTCSQVVGDPCNRDIDCPFDFCTQEIRRCFFEQDTACSSNADCTANLCTPGAGEPCLTDTDCPGAGLDCVDDVCQGSCTFGNTQCGSNFDCSPNFCRSRYVCSNDPDTECTQSLDCPQTFCTAEGRCLNNSSQTCNPASENLDNACQVGMCSRSEGMGVCDTIGQEPCMGRNDCPYYRCNPTTGKCHYPVEVACAGPDDCPEPGMICAGSGFCEKDCNSDADCPHARCQGHCIPMRPVDRMRCTDWFNPDRDCLKFGIQESDSDVF